MAVSTFPSTYTTGGTEYTLCICRYSLVEYFVNITVGRSSLLKWFCQCQHTFIFGINSMQLHTDKKIYKPKTKNKSNINILSSSVKNIDLISSTMTQDICFYTIVHFNILIH